jgi:hypothetical protein
MRANPHEYFVASAIDQGAGANPAIDKDKRGHAEGACQGNDAFALDLIDPPFLALRSDAGTAVFEDGAHMLSIDVGAFTSTLPVGIAPLTIHSAHNNPA